MKTNLRTHRSSRLKWVAALFFAFGIGNALPVSANFSPADELAIPNTTRSNREVNFNRNWKFFLGDTAAASHPDFDDNHWRTLDLPHDWSIEGRPEADNPAGNDGGYYPTGIGWYRKTFNFTPDSRHPETTLYFEGVYMNAEVFVNGHNLGIRPYGYSSFYHDITPYLKAGKNVIAVRVDNSGQKNCRWYTGSGIYRNVKLIRTPKAHFEPWGIGITTEQVNQKTQVEVKATLANRNKALPATLLCTVTDLDGHTILTQKETVTLEANRTSKIKLQFPFENAKLWSPETPNLYRMVCCLVPANGEPADTVTTTFGVRHVEYNAEKGLVLNGKAIEMNGGCLHHDNGPLGAASYRDAEWRKARLMKEAGFNAVRTSHNPPSEAFLDACDHLGLLVIDESFDGWRSAKTPKDYSVLFDQWWTKDIESMVLRDRNHPSLVTWTPLNETWSSRDGEYTRFVRDIYNVTKAIDPTRPVNDASGDDHVVTDIWTVHNYEADGNKLFEQLKFVEGKEPYRNTKNKPFLAVYEGQPYMVDEFGGIGWMSLEERKDSWGYGGLPQTEEEFYSRLEGQIKALKASEHVVGFCYTQLTDVEQEKNGIYYYDRRPKLDMKRIKAIFELIPSTEEEK